MTTLCPLCFSLNNSLLYHVKYRKREYLRCSDCSLIYMDQKHFPCKKEEKERYEQHNNGADDLGYVNFLYRSINPALKYIQKEMRGLDYGCGPGPVLASTLENRGYHCDKYDPYFFPDLKLNDNTDSQNQYDYIFSTEVFEHMFNPAEEMRKLRSLLRSGGILIIMTELWNNIERFSKWYYVNDISHVCFYHIDTIKYICKKFGFEQIYSDEKRVFILRIV